MPTDNLDPSVDRHLNREGDMTECPVLERLGRAARPMLGPWVIFVDGADRIILPAGRLGEIARTDEAHCNLIAAAPDLLDAVKGLRLHLKRFCGPDDAIANSVFEIADAAIKKAQT